MSEALPPPPIDAEVDLTAFPFMPLNVRRLRDSRFAAISEGEAFRTGVLLWCAAWHQLPAGSLPDDDVELANLAGFGRAIGEWAKVREAALYGWRKHSDGRLYHQVIVEAAHEAWGRREEWQEQRRNDEDRKTRYRERLRELSAQLRTLGIPVPKNRSLEVLEQLLNDALRGRSGDDAGTPVHSGLNAGKDVPGALAGTTPGTQRGQGGDSVDARGFTGDSPGMANKGTGTGKGIDRDRDRTGIIQSSGDTTETDPTEANPRGEQGGGRVIHELELTEAENMAGFARVLAAYPKPPRWFNEQLAERNCRLLIERRAQTWDSLETRAKAFAEHVSTGGMSRERVYNPENFFEHEGPWTHDWQPVLSKAELARRAAAKADAEKLERLKASRAELGIADFRDPLPMETPGQYETSLKLEVQRRPTPSTEESARAASEARDAVKALVRAKAIQS